MITVFLAALVFLFVGVPVHLQRRRAWGRYRSFAAYPILLGLSVAAGTVALATQPDVFDERDTRVFKAAGCTKDSQPAEALYYIVASRSDLSAGLPSPSAQMMKDEVENNWRRITSRLTMQEVTEERFADTYHALLSEMMPRLQQAVEEKSGVSISVSEVNSRPMDRTKDQDVPTCSSQ